MQKKHFFQKFSLLFIISSYHHAIAGINPNVIIEDVKSKTVAAPVNHRANMNRLATGGREILATGAETIVFDSLTNILIKNVIFQAGTFEGKGIINAENIKIVADRFLFNGTLKYTQSCIIVTPEPIDTTLFSCQGTVAPTFIVEPTLQKYVRGSGFARFDENGGWVSYGSDPRKS